MSRGRVDAGDLDPLFANEPRGGEPFRFRATIDFPINFAVSAYNEDEAAVLADDKFSEIYEMFEIVVKQLKDRGKWPQGASLGERYDDTTVEEDD